MHPPQFHETFDWLKPAPLWTADGSDIANGDLFRPRLLKFTSDQFVDEFLAAVKQSAMGAGAALEKLELKSPDDGPPFRLYQPAHRAYYFVCASLCCRQPGFPDRVVRRAKGDRVVFVIRKVQSDGTELGWTGPRGKKQWSTVLQPATTIVADEDRLPLMNVDTRDGRTLLFGYVPVGSRDLYAASQTQLNDDKIKYELRAQEFGSRFTGNLVPYYTVIDDPNALDSILERVKDTPNPTPNTGPNPIPNQLIVSVNILRDVVSYFETYLPDIYQALDPANHVSLSPALQAVVDLLDHQIINGSISIWAALQTVAKNAAGIDAGIDTGAAVTDLGFNDDYNLVRLIENLRKNPPPPPPKTANSDGVSNYAATLNMAVQAALSPEGTLSFELPKFSGNDQYVLRLGYERTACDPPQQWLSRKTDPFELAGFFDTDAPARPIRITMPGDVSLAGIRKFQKNVSIIMSASMQQKVKMVAGHEVDLTAGKGGGSGGDGIGYVCSFSIQIIFIVAFMLLLIFVVLLNLVFFWLPFFKICFPIPASLTPKNK